MDIFRRTGSVAGHAEPVPVQVFYIHFARAPWEIRRRLANFGATALVLLVQRIDVPNGDKHPGARLPLTTFAQKYVDIATRNTPEAWWFAPVPFLNESQL